MSIGVKSSPYRVALLMSIMLTALAVFFAATFPRRPSPVKPPLIAPFAQMAPRTLFDEPVVNVGKASPAPIESIAAHALSSLKCDFRYEFPRTKSEAKDVCYVDPSNPQFWCNNYHCVSVNEERWCKVGYIAPPDPCASYGCTCSENVRRKKKRDADGDTYCIEIEADPNDESPDDWCSSGIPDCDDGDPAVNPRADEGPQFFDGSGCPLDFGCADCNLCWDGKDNDCDGLRDGGEIGCNSACPGTPIVIDTRGDGFHLVGLSAGVRFDLLGNGHPMRTGWIQGDEALLVLDRNGNGLIESGRELFGNVTRLRSGRHAQNGYLALVELDDNRDGVLDARDAAFATLRLWFDRNVNGRTEPGELMTLAQSGIGGIELNYRESRRRDPHGNEFRYRAKVYGPGPANRFSYDVIFVQQP